MSQEHSSYQRVVLGKWSARPSSGRLLQMFLPLRDGHQPCAQNNPLVRCMARSEHVVWDGEGCVHAIKGRAFRMRFRVQLNSISLSLLWDPCRPRRNNKMQERARWVVCAHESQASSFHCGFLFALVPCCNFMSGPN